MENHQNLILFLGADWWGSDARALAAAFRKQGSALIEVCYEDHLPIQWNSIPLRLLRRLLLPAISRSFNRAVMQHLDNKGIDFLLVFKGMLLEAPTLVAFRERGVPCYCFYPDVSFSEHGKNVLDCLSFYDCVFTTKSFHHRGHGALIGARDVQEVSHGYDPEVHRPLILSAKAAAAYSCEVSFVGCWSPKKERYLRSLIDNAHSIDLRIWGTGWARASQTVRSVWQGRGAYGDELALVYTASKINLGLLSEAGSDTDVGDGVTARTWQIPASGAFLLHEATEELGRYFEPGVEVGTFGSVEELRHAVQHYLARPDDRSRIAAEGHRRALRERYTYTVAAVKIAEYFDSSSQCGVDRPKESCAS